MALNAAAVLCMETDRLDEGEELLRRALAIRSALPVASRDDESWLNEAAGLTCNLGTIDRDRGRFESAETCFRDAISLQREAIRARPDYQSFRNDLYTFRWNLADVFVRSSRHTEAVAEVADIVREFPERLQAHVEGMWLLMRCLPAAAANDAQRCRILAGELMEKTSTATFAPPDVQGDLAWLLATCPHHPLRDGGRAVQLARQLTESDPHNLRYQRALSAAYLETDDFDQAYQAAVAARNHTSVGSMCEFLLLALAQAGRGEWDDAREWYTKALAAQTDAYCQQGLLADAKSVFDPAVGSGLRGVP